MQLDKERLTSLMKARVALTVKEYEGELENELEDANDEIELLQVLRSLHAR